MVHPQSVIPTWINNWIPPFYESITDKENYSYNTFGVGVWQPLFQQLVNAMDDYRNFNREGEVYDFITATYGYVAMNKNFGTDGSLINTFDSWNVYRMNDFVWHTTNRPVNYYDDAVLGDSPKMTADIATVNGAVSAESGRISSISGASRSATRPTTFQMYFGVTFPPPDDPFTKDYVKDLYFNTLKWKRGFTLNMGNLQVPPGV